MKNEIENLKGVIDTLLIENALNTAHLKTLTSGFFNLASHSLNKDELSNLKSHFYNILYEKSEQLLGQPGYLFQPARGTMALLELHSFVQQQLKDIEPNQKKPVV